MGAGHNNRVPRGVYKFGHSSFCLLLGRIMLKDIQDIHRFDAIYMRYKRTRIHVHRHTPKVVSKHKLPDQACYVGQEKQTKS